MVFIYLTINDIYEEESQISFERKKNSKDVFETRNSCYVGGIQGFKYVFFSFSKKNLMIIYICTEMFGTQ